MEDKLIKDLLVSIAFIAKIVIGIVWKVKGIFTPGIGWVILFIAAAIFVPMGFTICFIICKLIGVLTLGWGWIILTLFLDGMMVDIFFHADSY